MERSRSRGRALRQMASPVSKPDQSPDLSSDRRHLLEDLNLLYTISLACGHCLRDYAPN
jgi:hypothetical protein